MMIERYAVDEEQLREQSAGQAAENWLTFTGGKHARFL
jgi:hypothetical protein